jgi:hypothetical protein
VASNKPYPFKPVVASASDGMGNQLGFYTFNTSNTPFSKLPFPSYQVGINFKSKLVYYVSATKQFTQMKECQDNLKLLAENLKPLYGTSTKNINKSKLEKTSGDITIFAGCSFGVSPYSDLSLIIKSESQSKNIEKIMASKYAR